MKRSSTAIGSVSVCLLGTALIGGPTGFFGIWAAAATGIFAATRGSKWWLVVPAAIVLVVSALVVLGNDPAWTVGGLTRWK